MTAVLTPRQHAVARLYAAGHPRAEIGRRLALSLSTVDQHVRAARARLGVRSRRAMAIVLPDARIACARSGALSAQGWVPGDVVRVVGGRYAGRVGVYLRRANAAQVYVRIGGAVVAPNRAFVEREAA